MADSFGINNDSDACYYLGYSISKRVLNWLEWWNEMESWEDNHEIIILYLSPEKQGHVNVRTRNLYNKFKNGLPTSSDGDGKTPDSGYVTLPPEYQFDKREEHCIKLLGGRWELTTTEELKKKVDTCK